MPFVEILLSYGLWSFSNPFSNDTLASSTSKWREQVAAASAARTELAQTTCSLKLVRRNLLRELAQIICAKNLLGELAQRNSRQQLAQRNLRRELARITWRRALLMLSTHLLVSSW